MTKSLMSLLFATAVFLPQLAAAHGIPVFFSVGNDGRVKTDALSYTSDADPIGGGAFFTEIPGYSVKVGESSVPNNAQIAVSVLSPLYFSPGLETPAVPDVNGSLLYFDSVDDERVASGVTNYLPPITVAAYSPLPTADWHEHLFYTLTASEAEPAAYGVLLQIISPNHPEILPSAPFAVVFNTGMDDALFGDIADQMSRKLLSTGDLNFDGIVDIQDVTIAANNWLSTNAKGDANHDGVVDIQDITLIANKWLQLIGPGPGGYFPQATQVPEPTSCLLLVAAVPGLFFLRGIGRQRMRQPRPVEL
jgi:hypothetical protein